MTVGIVTDSAASIPAELVAQHDISVVPMVLTLGDRSYDDGDIDLKEVLDRLDEGFSTSGPAPGRFLAGLEAADQGEGVVVITVSGTMSATHASAVVAAGTYDGPVEVVDTRTAAGGEALVVLHAARLAAAGRPLDEVAAAARSTADQVHLVATVADLDYLARSGRVPAAVAWAGRRLAINPVFEFRGGEARPLLPARGRAASLDHILARWRRTRPAGARTAGLHVAALHALEPGPAEDLLAVVQDEVTPAGAFVASFSAVMVAHTGPGLVGLSWWWEPGAPSS